MDQQRTLRHPVEMAGIGLHSGEPVSLRVSPAGDRPVQMLTLARLDPTAASSVAGG